MGMLNLNSSLRYTIHGRKRKTKAFTQRTRKPEFKPMDYKPNPLDEMRKAQAAQYKSLMEEAVKNGTFCQLGGKGDKKETLRYTGTLIKGIATMHKSNAIPVIDDQHAIDIAKMRR